MEDESCSVESCESYVLIHHTTCVVHSACAVLSEEPGEVTYDPDLCVTCGTFIQRLAAELEARP